MQRFATIVSLLVITSCGTGPTAARQLQAEQEPTQEIMTTSSQQSPKSDNNICGTIVLNPKCDASDGSGFFVFSDDCDDYAAVGMNQRETELFCNMRESVVVPQEVSLQDCPVPGLCGNLPIPIKEREIL